MTKEEYDTELMDLMVAGPFGDEDPLALADEAVRVFPDAPMLWLRRAEVIRTYGVDTRGVREVLESLQRATELDPDWVEAWESLGRFYRDLEREAEAREADSKVARLIALRPVAAFAPYQVVELRQEQGARSYLNGELGTISCVDYETGPHASAKSRSPQTLPPTGEYFYLVELYRHPMHPYRSVFAEARLEATGQWDGLYSDQPVESAAVRGAKLATSRRQPYICQTVSLGPATPGIGQGEKHLVCGLPIRTIACGCTDPRHERAWPYAEMFNKEILRWIRSTHSGG